jgi:Heterokaryon incompatibility protein (HET)
LKNNSLPTCQIRLMIKYMSKLPWTQSLKTDSEVYDDRVWTTSEPVGDRPAYTIEEMASRMYFWIDTICVPHTASKGKAIAQMRSVYRRANRVLVLDADLLATDVVPVKKQLELRPDVLAKISAATWQKRYWTLQEAVLAKHLYFQFKEDAYEKRKVWEFLEQEEREERHRGTQDDSAEGRAPNAIQRTPDSRPNEAEYFFDDEVCYYCETTDYEWGAISPHVPDAGRAFITWKVLASRACSFASDKPLCIAILLDMKEDDIAAIERIKLSEAEEQLEEAKRAQRQEVKTAGRVKKLWELLSVIPAGLLSFPAKKHVEAHLKWAPVELDLLSAIASPVWHPANISSAGIKVALHGFTAKMPPSFNPHSVIPITLEDKVYYIRNNTRNCNEPWAEATENKANPEPTESEPKDRSTEKEPKRNIDFSSVKEIGVILGQEPLKEGKPAPELKGALGTLVAVKRQEGEELVVRFLGAISVIGHDSVFDRHPTVKWSPQELKEKEAEKAIGVKTDVFQKWLIEL